MQEGERVLVRVPDVAGSCIDAGEALGLFGFGGAETVAAALEGGFGHDAVKQDAALVGVAPQTLDTGLQGGLGQALGDLLVEFGKRVRRRCELHHCGNLFGGNELHG